ncbi:MAG: NADH-quinone oxidoreductase subunit D, partial [Gammaproteobacteria bacterium]
KRVREVLDGADKLLDQIERVMYNNVVFKARSKGLGIITPDMVDPYGIVGPNARAAGMARDLRKDEPYLVYDQLDFEVVTGTASDAYERAWMRLQESRQCISLLRQILDRMPGDGPLQADMPNVLHWKIPPGETYVKAECTRGEYGYYMVTDGSEYIRRVFVRGPSYTHAIAVMERLAVGTNIADIAGLMVSLHTYPPEIER